MTEFDDLAALYDATRGGERRGNEYAVTIDELLPRGDGHSPILEIGTGTGVVALGLRRLGRQVLGLDLSLPMLVHGYERLGPSVVLSDAMDMAVAAGSIAHAFSVWVVHSVADPRRLFAEAARILRPGGSYVVCTTQRPAPDDEIGHIIVDMGSRIDLARNADRPRNVSGDEVLTWAAEAGFTGSMHESERTWRGSPEDEIVAIERRAWPTMRGVDAASLDAATRPALDALRGLESRYEPRTRTGIAEAVVLTTGG